MIGVHTCRSGFFLFKQLDFIQILSESFFFLIHIGILELKPCITKCLNLFQKDTSDPLVLYLHTLGPHTASSHLHCNTRGIPLSPVVTCSYSDSPPAPRSHRAQCSPPWWPRSRADRDLSGWCWPGRGSRTLRLFLCSRPSLLFATPHI